MLLVGCEFLISYFFSTTSILRSPNVEVMERAVGYSYVSSIESTVGSTFKYKQKGFEVYFTDRITDFADSTIILENNLIAIDQIAEVDIQNAFSNRAEILMLGENYLPWIGAGLLAIDLINHTLVDGNDFSLDRGVTTVSAALIGTGLALKFFRRKKVNLLNPKFEAFIIGL